MIPGRTKNFIGQDGMFFFFGIVEDRLDPEGAGRVRVRCFGIHTGDKTLLPTNDLPWATVSSPVSDTDSPHDLVESDMVWGFFVDGQEMQEPLVCGCIQSKPGGNKNPQQGFTDPGTGLSSRPNKPSKYEPDGFTNGEAKNFSSGDFGKNLNSYSSGNNTPSDQAKSVQAVSDIKLPGGKTTSEPSNPADRKYPFNKPKESESGHVFEMDDTPGHERVHVFHRSGSFIEIHPDGTVVKKDIANGYDITLGKKVIYSKSDMALSTDGTYSQVSGSSYTLEVSSGDMTIDVKSGNINIIVNGNANFDVKGDKTENITGNYAVKVAGNYSVTASMIDLNS